MIKTILVPASGDRTDLVALAGALSVAQAFRAHIDVLHVRQDAVDIAVAMSAEPGGGMLINGVIEQLERDASEREAVASRQFQEFCAREQLATAGAASPRTEEAPTAQWHCETGNETRWMTTYGMAAELIVAGRGANHEATARSLLEAALLETGRPLLIPGETAGGPDICDTIAIAWKSTPEAARAVTASLPFIARARHVVVMTVEEGGRSEDQPDRLVDSLGWHGCRVTAERIAAEGREPADALLAAAQGRAGLLVMGGYGHGRLREWVFGGFTQRVLADAPLPVLMAH